MSWGRSRVYLGVETSVAGSRVQTDRQCLFGVVYSVLCRSKGLVRSAWSSDGGGEVRMGSKDDGRDGVCWTKRERRRTAGFWTRFGGCETRRRKRVVEGPTRLLWGGWIDSLGA
ncbi:uncharacterized protein LY79DRAFT_569127 [Colletotrichum navitas]|uniref:Uncharacterized protein n=1 Tax=Colletotrichum navitas TaxID=681940 RepID=A0AAD8UZF8_9PEZI|nr:uncharacterized protein LY79DRAFT_569127 [Colletotrichum navitas]KAK1573118.1 hypothetical protein LY79DRAFT_569127 [Colletotrichum navitas]